MKKAIRRITIITFIITALALCGCGKKEDTLFIEEKGQYEASHKNCLIDLPESITKKTENVGVLTNDCEMSKAYSSDTTEALLYTRMDSYYVHVFKMDREDYKKKNLSDYIFDNALTDIEAATEVGRQTTPAGVKKIIYRAEGQVLPCRDLYADMTGHIAVMTYRNDVWIATVMSAKEDDVTLNIAKSLRVNNVNKVVKACSIERYTEHEAEEGGKPESVGEWGEITVMNKRITGEPTKILACVKAVYDSADSYGLITKYSEELEQSHYALESIKGWNVAEIEVDYGSVNREKYDPYIDVKILDEDGKYLQRTYKLASEGNSLYVLFKEPKDNYKLQVGDTDQFVVSKD